MRYGVVTVRAFFYGWTIIAAGTILLAASFGISYSFGVFLKPLQNEFLWDRATASSLFSLFLALTGAVSIVGGWASDRYGPRMVVLIMGALSGLSLVLTSQVQSPWQLYITYSVLLSLGMGAMYIVVMSTGMRWFTRKRATALGIMGAGGGLGPIVIAPVSAWIISVYSWRAAYLIMGIAAWVIVIPAALFLRKEPPDTDPPARARSEQRKTESERPTAVPNFSLMRLIRARNFRLLSLAWFSYAFCFYMVMSHLVPRAEDSGMTPIHAAAILSLLTAVAIPSRLLFGFVADLVDKRTIAAAFALMMSLAMFWLAFAHEVWMFYLFAILFGIGYGSIDPPIAALAGDIFGLSDAGMIMGYLMVAWGIGSASGPYVAGLIFDHTAGYPLAFSSGGLVMAIGVGCLFRMEAGEKGKEISDVIESKKPPGEPGI